MDSLQHGRVLDSLGHRILAVHCGEIMAVQRKASDYIVRPNIAARDAERIMAVFRSADLIANICHKFFVPAGGNRGGLVVAAWDANANQPMKPGKPYAVQASRRPQQPARTILAD